MTQLLSQKSNKAPLMDPKERDVGICHLKTGVHSEKHVVSSFWQCANITEFTYTNLGGKLHYSIGVSGTCKHNLKHIEQSNMRLHHAEEEIFRLRHSKCEIYILLENKFL